MGCGGESSLVIDRECEYYPLSHEACSGNSCVLKLQAIGERKNDNMFVADGDCEDYGGHTMDGGQAHRDLQPYLSHTMNALVCWKLCLIG